MFNQYISNGIWILKGCIGIGLIIYSIFLGILWMTKKRRTFKMKQTIFEVIFVIYTIAILQITGIIGMKFYFFNGFYNINLIPFKDVSIMMLLLNFLLFVPYGFLLPLVFKKLKTHGKKVLLVGFITSFSIESLQLFGGRYTEVDDILANSLGTFVGFVVFYYVNRIISQNNIT